MSNAADLGDFGDRFGLDGCGGELVQQRARHGRQKVDVVAVVQVRRKILRGHGRALCRRVSEQSVTGPNSRSGA